MDHYELSHIIESDSKKTSLESSVYYNLYHSMIHWHDYGTDTLGMSQAAVNAVIADRGWMGQQANAPGSFASIGFESVYRFVFKDWARSNGSFTGLTNTDNQMWALFPQHSAKGNYRFKPLDKVTLVSLNAIYQVNQDLGFNLLVDNLLNDKSPTPGENSTPATHAVDNKVGTTVYAGVTYKL